MTSEFHRIHREIEKTTTSVETAGARGASEARAKKAELERQLQSIGGRQAYQEASVLTTSRHRTCKWVFAVITKLGLRPKKHQPALRVLEVGAVNTQLMSVPWLEVRAIDIKAQHPRIEQVDFFDITPKGNFDVVVASMVLNCVSSPLERGSMLALTRKHLTPGGHLFLMIPRRCIENSPYCSSEVLSDALWVVGLKVVDMKLSPKVAFFCARRHEGDLGERANRFRQPPKRLAGLSMSQVEGMNDTFAISFDSKDIQF